MDKPKQQKWWIAGPQYDNDVRKKLQKDQCTSAKRSMIQCKTLKKSQFQCIQQKRQYSQCLNMLGYLSKHKNSVQNAQVKIQ